MSIDSINNATNYSASGTTGTGGTSNVGKSSNSTLNMDDFFSLIVAQLKNQDMYNTVDDTQYIQQMAQFSMIQALSDMSELSMTSYGVSLIGKEVTVASVKSDGSIQSIKGLVDSVTFYNGSPQVVVEGKNYSLSSVMAVKEPDIIIPKTPETNGSQNNNTGGTEGNGDSTGSGDTTGNGDTTGTGDTTGAGDTPGDDDAGSGTGE